MKTIYYTIVIFILTVLQTTLFAKLSIFGIKPLLLFAMLIIISINNSGLVGGIYGLIIGLIFDTLGGGPFGLHSVIFMYVGVFCSILGEKFFREKVSVVILSAFIFNLIYAMVYFFLTFAIWGRGKIWDVFAVNILLESAYTSVFAVILYFLDRKTGERLGIYT